MLDSAASQEMGFEGKLVNLRHFPKSRTYEDCHFIRPDVTFVTAAGGTCDTAADHDKSGLAFHKTNYRAARNLCRRRLKDLQEISLNGMHAHR